MAKRYEELTIEDDFMFGKPIRLDVYTKDRKRQIIPRLANNRF